MGEIEIDKEYVFKRGRTYQVAFIRFADGTAAIYQNGRVTIWKEGEQPWKQALADLRAQGFENSDAR